MTRITPATARAAANDNPGGSTTAQVALHGLVALMARAEVQAVARQAAAKATEKKRKKEKAQ